MSDSENENIFSYPNVNTTVVSAKGPNTNISNLSIRQRMTSNMFNMPRNFERQRYAQSVCDQRSMYRKDTSAMSTRSGSIRETSPMSIRSAFDMGPNNYQPYIFGMNSRKLMHHGRSRSPASLRSIDSSTSLSANDIVFAFKTMKYTSHDIQRIKYAYSNLMKLHTRERFERKRNHRVFLKGNRKSGDDSGEQASDSSVSGDDCRSPRTTISKVSNNMSKTQFDFDNLRSTTTDNIIRDCTDVRQNKCKNIFSLDTASVNSSLQSNSAVKQNILLKDRFKGSFLLPSQRFNQSVASMIISENSERQHNKNKNVQNTMQQVKNHLYQRPKNMNSNTDSEDEEIFSETVKENIIFRTESKNKRSLDEDELNLPYNKRKKISSPIKNATQNIAPVPNNNKNKIVNNFEFVKPALPTKKVKPKIQQKQLSKFSHPQEKLIAKSSQPLTDFIEPVPYKPKDTTESSKQSNVQEEANTGHTNVLMRPSFIKRKLYTQNLNVIEKSNLSSDGVNSPQTNACSDMPKEKNRTRKLVTTQSCLNREVQDDNNLLDLIHKIVPPDQMNATSQSSVNLTRSNGTKPVEMMNKKDDEDKWDITTVISMCNDDDCSDTYTDEEIKSDNKVIEDPKTTSKSLIHPCSVDLIKMPVGNNKGLRNNNLTTNKLQSCAKSFWDTDSESDFEWPYYKSKMKENPRPANVTIHQEAKNAARNTPSSKTTAIPDINASSYNTAVNNTINSQKLKVGNVSFRSHRVPKKKKCCNETCVNETKSAVEPQIKNLIDTSKPIRKPQTKITPKSNPITDGQNKNELAKNDIRQLTEGSALTKHRSASDTKEKTKSKPDENTKTMNKKLKPKAHSKADKSVKLVRNKCPKTKAIKPAEVNYNKNTNIYNLPNTSSDLDSTVQDVQNNSSLRQRPLRSCRSTSQNRSVEKSLQIGNDSGFSKSLRSRRVMNLSSSNDNISVHNNLPNTNSNLDSTVETVHNNSTLRERPLRSCRATSQNRSMEKSLQMGNDSGFSKSLRSRTVMNFSSSIENISLDIKPRSKAVNKTVAQINSRKSDVSFSLGNKNATTPIRSARNKGKR